MTSPELPGVTRASVIIPAYSEEGSLGALLDGLKRLEIDAEILVIDDNSNDQTSQIALQRGVRVIRHPYRMGNGAAIKTGIRNATNDLLVMLDADGQHPASEISKLLRAFPGNDMVVGARSPESNFPTLRRFGNWALTRVAEWLCGLPIADLTSGFRVIKRRHALEFVHLLPNAYSYPTTLTMAMLKSGLFVKHVHVEFRSRSSGRSHISPVRDGFRFLVIMMRIIMLFDPLKVFIPTSLFFIAAGVALGGWQYLQHGHLQTSFLFISMTGVFIFFFGLLAEQIAQVRRAIRSPEA